MRLTYDPRFNIAYIRFRQKSTGIQSIKVSEELTVDMAPDGTIYGIELLNANEQLQRDEMGAFTLINEATGEHVVVPLATP
jgi:uncharacterized protein YuzE